MKNFRIISRLDIKGENLIKGIRLEGLRKLGDPYLFALEYFEKHTDEIIYVDNVASLYNRDSILNIIEKTTQNIFIPITVCGGIRSLEHVEKILKSGADKIGINSAAIKNPNLIKMIAKKFGSQCVTLSIEAKKRNISWEALYNNGREKSGLDVFDWAKKAESLGAGEILITSVDKDGTQQGFDLDLIEKFYKQIKIPIIVSGGFGKISHLNDLFDRCDPDAVAIASAFHYKKSTINDIREYCIKKSKMVREI